VIFHQIINSASKNMLRLIVALVMVPSYINAQMPPPFDPNSGCPLTTQMTPDFSFEFKNARVVHKNLGGQYCGRITDGDGCSDVYPGTTQPIAEILYCDISVKNDDDEELNPDLCLRIVDVIYSCVEPCNACKTTASDCDSWHYNSDQCDEKNMSECDCLVACGVNSAPGPLDVDIQLFNLLNDLRNEGYTCGDGTIYAPNADPLEFDCRLWKASQGHSQDMADNNYFSHDSQDGTTFSERATAQGIAASGENIAAGSADAATTLQQWKESNGHCNNMMSPEFKLIGVALGENVDATYDYYWTQMFARDSELPADTSCLSSSATRYDCTDDNDANCGLVHETEESIFGQIKYDMGGENHFRAEFSTVECKFEDGVYNYTKCEPVYWDTMVMSFLDIDGNDLLQENIILHDAFNYMMAYSEQDAWGDDFTPCVNDMFNPNRRCFPQMQIWFNDQNGVYTHLNAADGEPILNANSGDVTISNMNSTQISDGVDVGFKNGNVDNPTDLADLAPPQIKRAVSGIWVSPANKKIVQDTISSQTTSQPELDAMKKVNSFQVSMGLFKRTVLFSGWASSITGEYCQTCRNGYLNQHSCNDGDVLNFNTVCVWAEKDINLGCNYNTCCSPATTSHGDPIIWTFHDECYDLNKDGLWLATSHPAYDHEVKIAVYNDYMRELQVLTKSGDLLLSINNMGEVVKKNFPYDFSQETLPCPGGMKECINEYKEFKFDIQDFQFVVQTLRHDYLDPALKEGENGYHLDIYPKTYEMFGAHKNGYSGLYFENPLPDELEYCLGGSLRVGRDGIAYN